MKLILPIYIVSVGNVLIGIFDLWLSIIDHKPSTTVYGAIFNMIGITGCLIATALRSQEIRIKDLEQFSQHGIPEQLTKNPENADG